MKKVDLMVYKDKIKKLHKAAVALKDAHKEYDTFEDNKLLSDEFSDEDWKKLSSFMESNPDLGDKIEETERIIKNLIG
jgi:hypothetical protein